MFNLDPLINQLKEYNQNQARTNQLLEEIKELLKNATIPKSSK
jgi:hypothetical protein